MTRESKPIKVCGTPNGKDIYVTFVHTDNYTVHALITASSVPGHVRMIRDSEDKWVPLEDSLDRTMLFAGVVPYPLQLDIEKVYLKYALDEFSS